ncbi:MAG: hypothetical protein ACTHMS_10095 [Jatrophihabitans sp.]|uniref:hypothetical protein n=1 Tax=Jatrophihabitans sp. TaxID=1932789 RepID=UPI003F7DA46B
MAYLALNSASIAAFRHPKTANMASINRYANGQARVVFQQTLTQARAQGIAYRGTPATPRVTVISVHLDGHLPEVVLRDCGLISSVDPEAPYYVATGKRVPQPTPKVPPPYANKISLFKPSGAWQVFTISTDASKTCQP